MLQGIVDQTVDEFFTVSDIDGSLISGIDSSAFITYVYNPNNNEVSSSVNGNIIELGNGNYKYTFVPDTLGTWYIVLIHQIYFPWGKTDDIQVYSSDITEIALDVKKTLGLSHNNYYIDQPLYDEFGNMIGGRIRIYSDAASVGTDSNVIETYRVESEAEACGQFNYWKQIVSP